MNTHSISKEMAWDIMRCCMLWFEGAEPEAYGFDAEISRIGKNLADALHMRIEKLILYYKNIGKMRGGDKFELQWVQGARQ